MNLKQTLQLFNPFHKGYDLPLLQKAASSMGVNLFDRSFYQMLGVDMPVWMEDKANEYLERGYLNADVFAITNYRANLQRNVKWKLYKKNGTESWDILEDHELLSLVNGLDLHAMSVYEDVTGNSYVYAPWLESGVNRGKATELSVLKSDLVQIVSGGAMEPVRGYKYIIDQNNSKGIDKAEVLHFKNFNPSSQAGSDLYGMSPLKAAIRQVSLSNAGTDSMAASYKNQGVKAIVYSKDNENVQWTEEQAVGLKRSWEQKNGIGRNGSVVFHSKELGKIDLGLSPVELNTLAGMLHSFRQLCNIYDGFPSQLLNDNESSTYNNLDSADKRVYMNCVLPRRSKWRDGLNEWLTPRYGADLYLDFDTSDISVLQENKKETAEWVDKAWYIKVKDKQKILGTPEDPNMDLYMVPNNLIPVKDIGDLTRSTDIEEEMKALKEKGVSEYGQK
ncbi:phage portal protein [Nibribacter koreensis]|uniref:Phage portal protein, HK97 family n=1 Tax=Nibribacter koreensis TaxID=1084519 RepID=A0ABP8FBV0_9BACT